MIKELIKERDEWMETAKIASTNFCLLKKEIADLRERVSQLESHLLPHVVDEYGNESIGCESIGCGNKPILEKAGVK